jgi:hypothetical protein
MKSDIWRIRQQRFIEFQHTVILAKAERKGEDFPHHHFTPHDNDSLNPRSSGIHDEHADLRKTLA